MGEETPEPVEIQCPGCESRFRLTPKKGRLPSGDIPCPKCFEEIPVQDGKVMTEEADDTSSKRSDSAPGFGVTAPASSSSAPSSKPERSTQSLDEVSEEEQEAIEKLEQMAEDLPSSGSKSTMAGLPGVGRDNPNPFSKSRNNDKTATVDQDTLRQVASESSNAEMTGDESTGSDSAGDGAKSPSSSFDSQSPPDTSPRLVEKSHTTRLAEEDSTAATAPEEIPEDNQSRSGLRDTAEHKSAAKHLRETAENKSPSDKSIAKAKKSSTNSSRSDKADADDKSSLLGRIKKKTIRKQKPSKKSDENDDPPSPFSQTEKTSRAKSLDQLKKQSTPPDSPSKSEDSDSDSDDDSSLSNLFQKVRDRRGDNKLRDKLKETSKAKAESPENEKPVSELADEVDFDEGELADIVDRSADDDRTDSQSKTDAKDDSNAPIPPPSQKKAGETTDSSAPPSSKTAGDEDHSGLFDEVGSAAPPTPASKDEEIQDVSSKREKTTSQSMLARLKKGGDKSTGGDAPLDIGAAGEKRGSGYIRLPTDEIQDVLGQGDFRLKIEGVVYEPVDKDGLIRLIKGGVLLGAEEIAEAGGDWMPISEHPVFGELRRKMAAEAHEVLSRIGSKTPSRDDADTSDEPEEPTNKPPKNAPPAHEKPTKSADKKPPPEPSTTEMSSAELAAMASKSTGTHESVERSPDDDPPPKPEDSTATDSQTDGRDSPSVPQKPAEENSRSTAVPESPGDTGSDSAMIDAADDDPSPDPDDIAEPEPEPAPTKRQFAPAPEQESPPEASPAPASAPSSQPDTTDDPTDSGSFAKAIDEPDLGSAEDTMYDSQESGSRTTAYLAGTLLGLVVLGLAGVLMVTPTGQEILEDTIGWAPTANDAEATQEASAQPDAALQEAMAAADQKSGEAVTTALQSASDADESVQFFLDEGDMQGAVEVMSGQYEDGRDDSAFLARFAEALHDNGDYRRARRIALEGITEYPDDDFQQLHRQSIEDDASLHEYRDVEFDDPAGYRADGLYDVAGHRGIYLDDPDEPDRRLLFKPQRSDWTMGWRAEIASWRFCELVACHFDVFRVEPAVVTREFLTSIDGDDEAISRIDADAAWTTIEIADQPVEAVRGSLEYVPDTASTPFPIEYRPLWRDWLTAGNSTDFVDEPARDRLGALESLDGGRFYDQLTEATGQTPTGELARSVSSLLIFDYLTNNWERFFTRTADYGMNNPVRGASIVSRHNGEAFQSRASRRVRERFEWTTRFSKSTVETIEALDRDMTYQILFPESRTAERRRMDVFWQQRSDMLSRVDNLVARHGQSDVLLFP